MLKNTLLILCLATLLPRFSIGYRNRGSNETGIGYWIVYDESTQQNKTRPASCILASMKVTLEIVDLAGHNINLTVPVSARAKNNTCGEQMQQLELIWQEYDQSSLTFNFENDPNNTFNTMEKVEALFEVQIDNDTSYTVNVSSHDNLNMTRAPKLFAFVCRHPLRIPLNMSVLIKGAEESNETGHFSDTQVNLVLMHTRVETFRVLRYYDDFTHLKYDCVTGWPYQNQNLIVGLSLLAFAILVATCFVIRYKRRNRTVTFSPAKMDEELEQEEDNGTGGMIQDVPDGR